MADVSKSSANSGGAIKKQCRKHVTLEIKAELIKHCDRMQKLYLPAV
jgi:hypothetical protein